MNNCFESKAPLPAVSKAPAHPAFQIPSLVREVLEAPSQPLETGARAFMESRFGHDFTNVRIHTDGRASAAADSISALAYTNADQIVFARGQYAPETQDGRELLAHELAHVVQQSHGMPLQPGSIFSQPGDSGERAADRAASRIFSSGDPVGTLETQPATAMIQRQPKGAASPAASGPMTRGQFDQIMKDRYRVKTIRTGTFQDQSFGDMQESQWKAWDPGTSSQVYNWIVDAFANLEKAFGGLPQVDRMVFFETHYTRDNQGHIVKDSDVGASFALGEMMVYQSVLTGNKMLNQAGILETPTMEQAVKRNITHELGHGIAETALTQSAAGPPGADPTLFKDYNPAVGWSSDLKLYDIQEPAVKMAIANNTVPPVQFQITPANATSKSWKEQPLTAYMTDNPADDFAETIMAYVNEPDRLKKLSPTRFDFIDKRKGRWIQSGQPKMNIWEQAKSGGPARVLKPSQPPSIWEKAKEAQ